MIETDFDQRTYANMTVALEQVCRLLPKTRDNHISRSFVAERILACARNDGQTLSAFRAAGRRAVAELCGVNKQAS